LQFQPRTGENNARPSFRISSAVHCCSKIKEKEYQGRKGRPSGSGRGQKKNDGAAAGGEEKKTGDRDAGKVGAEHLEELA